MSDGTDRRRFLRTFIAAAGATVLDRVPGSSVHAAAQRLRQQAPPLFRISLAQWSLHRAFKAGTIDPLDFPRVAREQFDLDAVEYVNVFYAAKSHDASHFAALKNRADDHGVRSLLIMCDGEGALGDPDPARRATAIENHHKWVEHARSLGCHSIRVNAESRGSEDEQRRLAADGLRRLTEFAASHEINVLVENHGGCSSNGAWLASVIQAVAHPRCGTLPDFGNFLLGRDAEGAEQWYDRYRGVAELMPFAKAVSAKSHEFDDSGNETRTDYRRMLRIVIDAGYRGHVGIEYEGEKLDEPAGIKATRALLERVCEEIAAATTPR
jgi:sugar phosphate isomerase/epimerase